MNVEIFEFYQISNEKGKDLKRWKSKWRNSQIWLNNGVNLRRENKTDL